MPDRRLALRFLLAAPLALTVAMAAACSGGSASEVKMHRYVIGVSGMT